MAETNLYDVLSTSGQVATKGGPPLDQYASLQWLLSGSEACRCTCQGSSPSSVPWFWRSLPRGLRLQRRGLHHLRCRLLSNGPKRCRDPQRSTHLPSVALGPRVTVTTSSVSLKPATGNRVQSHPARARARSSHEPTMWACVASVGREHGRAGRNPPSLAAPMEPSRAGQWKPPCPSQRRDAVTSGNLPRYVLPGSPLEAVRAEAPHSPAFRVVGATREGRADVPQGRSRAQCSIERAAGWGSSRSPKPRKRTMNKKTQQLGEHFLVSLLNRLVPIVKTAQGVRATVKGQRSIQRTSSATWRRSSVLSWTTCRQRWTCWRRHTHQTNWRLKPTHSLSSFALTYPRRNEARELQAHWTSTISVRWATGNSPCKARPSLYSKDSPPVVRAALESGSEARV
jgi:hypothetical protein